MHSSSSKNIGIVTFLTNKFSLHDLVITSGLFLFSLATRIPFAARMIYHSDSVRFALAMEHYDVAQMRPHAPGYFLYVALAKFIDLFINDARVSLISLSIVASTLTILFLYFLASTMFERSDGIIAALLLLSSPLFWFNGEIPFTYALEGLFSVIFAYCCYKIISGDRKWLLTSAIILGLATGARQNIIILFLPLWLYSIRKCSFKKILIAFVVFGVTCLTWFTPMIALTGGLEKYFIALNGQFKSSVIHPSPLLFQIKSRGKIFLTFMAYSLTFGLIPIFFYFCRYSRISSILKDIRSIFLFFWFTPAIFFFIGINIWNPGHVVLVLPPLFIILSQSIKEFSIDIEKGLKRIIVARTNFLKRIFSYNIILVFSIMILILANFYIFLFKNTPISYAAIQKEDIRFAELIKLTKTNFSPEKSMVLALFYSTQAGYYLPDYLIYCPFPLIFRPDQVPLKSQNVYISFRHQTTPETYWVPTNFKIEPIKMPPGVDTIILWEKDIAEYYQNSNRPLRKINSHINDVTLFYIKVKPSDKIYYNYHFFSVK